MNKKTRQVCGKQYTPGAMALSNFCSSKCSYKFNPSVYHARASGSTLSYEDLASTMGMTSEKVEKEDDWEVLRRWINVKHKQKGKGKDS